MGAQIWPVLEAKRLLKRCAEKKEAVFEAGYGPSGLPHIGTFAEVVRTCFVIEALAELDPSIQTRLIAFSDDMDGLRDVPTNIIGGESLREHVGKPVSAIPDPFGVAGSYAEYMNQKLCEFLDKFELRYEFHSSSAAYAGGVFNTELLTIFQHYEQIKAEFIKGISEEKREQWSPFFVVCQNCGKINTTSVLSREEHTQQLEYRCDKTLKNTTSCGHASNTSVTDGRVKVGWKVDWAMRWKRLGIDYEMHGEDLTDSVKTSTKLCRILGGNPPLTYKYELFLDEEGRKISKKIGNGISMEQWLSYAPLGALLYFLLENPNKPRRMGLKILPELVDKYFHGLNTEDSTNPNHKIWFVARFRACINPKNPPKVSYTLLVNVSSALGILEPELLFDYAKRYDPAITEDSSFYMSLCEQVVCYVREYESLQEKQQFILEPSYLPHLKYVREHIAEQPEGTALCGDVLQTFLFSLAKQNELPMRDWFGFLYRSVLQRASGPKMGPFFATLGQEKSLQLLDTAIIRAMDTPLE